MFRWAFLVPRLILLLCLCLLLRFGMDPLLAYVFTSTGQAVTGAKVEVETLSSSLPHGRVYLRGLQIADRTQPMKNAVEVEEAWFKLDGRSLLDQRWIVDQGAVTGLQFHTDRQTSGALPEVKKPRKRPDGQPGLSDKIIENVERAAEDWLENVTERLRTDIESEFHSVRLTQELTQRWSAEYRDLAGRMDAWKARAEAAQQLAQAVRDEPLKHLPEIESGIREMSSVAEEIRQLQDELQRLHTQIQQDRLAVRDAGRHDATAIRQMLQMKPLDGEQLTNYLLGPELTSRVQQMSVWMNRGLEAYGLIGENPEINHERGRGQTIDFSRNPRLPRFLIRSLFVSGHTQLEGSDIAFRGRLDGVTLQPACYGRPITYQLATSGAIESVIQGSLDFQNATPRHHVVVSCPALHQPSVTLGDTKKLAFVTSGGTAQVWMEIWLEGRQISGQVRWRQDGLVVKPMVGSKLGGARLQQGFAHAARHIDRIHAVVELEGTLTSPRCRLKSPLGPQMAEGINLAVQQELNAVANDLASKADTAVNEQLAKMDTVLQSQHNQLLAQLQEYEAKIQEYKQQLSSKLQQPFQQLGQPTNISAMHQFIHGVKDKIERR